MAVFNLFNGESVCGLVPRTEGLREDELTRRGLIMDISSDTGKSGLDILVLEVQSRLVRFRNDEKVQTKGQYCNQRSREYIRNHHSVETDSARQYGNDL